MSKGLDDYTEVPERIRQFFDKYPEGSLSRVGEIEFKSFTAGDGTHKTFIVYTAAAYRTPDDAQPGIGTAWEPFPGLTNFTRNSELQNAETSAWGRALVALGFVAKKIATAEDVRNRQAENGLSAVPVSDVSSDWPAKASPRQGDEATDAAETAGEPVPAASSPPEEEVAGEVVPETIDPAFANDLMDACRARLDSVGQFKRFIEGVGVTDFPNDLRKVETRLEVLSRLSVRQGVDLAKALATVPERKVAA